MLSVWVMHLVSHGLFVTHPSFYRKFRVLARRGSLARIFHNLRIHRNLTRKSLAKKFGVTEDHIAAIESGSKFPSLKFCLFCGDLFGANPNWVKNKWVNESTSRFLDRIRKRLDLFD